MASEVDRQIARSQAVLDRVAGRSAATGDRRTREIGRRLTRIAIADAAILIAATVIGLVVPLGMFGALAVMLALIAATLLFALRPTERAPAPETLRAAPIRLLPMQTTRWLESQRPALPAPAIPLIDRIGARLETLAPQLAALEEGDPAAAEIRKLIGEQLPEFVAGYHRVPAPLRAKERNGRTPDAELVAGLDLIDGQIGELSEQLAKDALDGLATRGRFLEIKYRDERYPDRPQGS